jgi:phage terminase large subunit-like protein
LLKPGDRITLGFDGSEGTDTPDYLADSTVLVACRVSDGLLTTLGVWQHEHAGPWRPPRDEVEAVVADAFSTYNVTRMHCDSRGWETRVDEWAGKHGNVWRVPNSPKRQTEQIVMFEAAVKARDISHDRGTELRRHILNCRASTRVAGQSEFRRLGKPSQEDKIDLAIAALLAVEARSKVIEGGEKPTSRRMFTF